MDLITIDFETAYDKEYSLSKMTTEAYIRDRRFEVIGVGVKINDGPTDWYSGSNPGKFLGSLDYSKYAVLCHHAAFDGAILSWKYGIKPRLWLDTLSMARPLHSQVMSCSLASLASFYGLGEKGTEVINALGKWRKDFTPQELAKYGEYCCNDVDLTYALFQKLKGKLAPGELLAIDTVIRMFTEPMIVLDKDLLADHLADVLERKDLHLSRVAAELCVDKASVQTALMSNSKFAALLYQYNVEPPIKLNSSGESAYAFAKTDQGMLDLLEHPDDRVASLASARLGVKSTIEETRTRNLIGASDRGPMPVMLNNYGAHTTRLTGGDGMNFQNLPSRSNNTIRRALTAPAGHTIIACDSSQIEARTLAWLAGQDDLSEAFRDGRDVYSEFATEVYGRTITKADKVERFVGKTCIAEGTLVLSQQGWKPIESVTTSDLLWDGVEWVCHQGLLNNGIKPTLNLCGAWLTPDHQVWSGTQWLEAQSVVADEDTLYQVLGTGAENLPSQATWLASEVASAPSLCGVTVTPLSTQWTRVTSKISAVLAALFAPRQQHLKSVTGCTAKQWQTTATGLAFLTDSLQQLLGATYRLAAYSTTMAGGVSLCTLNGDRIGPHFCAMSRPSMGGINLISRWTELMWMGITNRGTFGSYRAAITSATNAKSQTLKRVYDILNCGSRNRFTILTEAGPVIVHNCVLGLGYGLGAVKLQKTLKLGAGGVSVDVTLDEAKRIVQIYRRKYWKIPQLWNVMSSAINQMLADGEGTIAGVLKYRGKTMGLSGYPKMVYPLLHQPSNRGSTLVSNARYVAKPRDYKKAIAEKVSGAEDPSINWEVLYGGKFTENCVQYLAAIINREFMVAIARRYRVILQVHDELVICVPDEQADEAERYMISVMSTPPKWARTLPVACESGRGKNYGDC